MNGVTKNKMVVVVLSLLGTFMATGQTSFASESWSKKSKWESAPSSYYGSTDAGPQSTPQQRRRKINRDISPFSPGSNNVAVDIGQVFLMGGLSDNYTDTIGFQAHYTYGVSEIFGFDSSIGYSSHSDAKSQDNDFSLITVLAGLRTNLNWYDRVVPYAVFGLGFYKPNYEFSGTSLSPILFGIHIGPGVDLQLTDNLFFGTSLTFHDIFSSQKVNPSTGAPLEVGGTYTSFLVHVGTTF